MRDDLIELKMVFDKLKISPDMTNFSDRLKLQKATYLTQLFGIDFGYRFSWYLRGPYSTDLTKDLFELHSNKDDISRLSRNYIFSKKVIKRLEKVKAFLKKPVNVDMQLAVWRGGPRNSDSRIRCKIYDERKRSHRDEQDEEETVCSRVQSKGSA